MDNDNAKYVIVMSRRIPLLTISALFFSILLILSTTVPIVQIGKLCASESGHGAIQDNDLVEEYWPTNGWRNSTPEEQHMNAAKLQEMIDHIIDENQNIHSVIVVRHGYVVLEEYPNPGSGHCKGNSYNGTHYLYSVTKSFISCFTGIAIDKGFIDNVSQTVLSLFPNRTFANMDERKERLTLVNLLTMRSGLLEISNGEWHLNFNTSGGVQYILDRPMEAEPNEIWRYQGGPPHLVSGIIQENTGMTTLEFGRKYLFNPLGIEQVYWPRDMQGVYFGGSDLQLRPLDMAKFGYLFLKNGEWDGEQIVSANWVEDSTSTYTTLDDQYGYGYLWWTLHDIGVFYAAGMWGQYIFVAPDYNLVAVFTSGLIGQSDEIRQMLREYILASVLDDPLPIDWTLPAILSIITAIPVIIAIAWVVKKRRVAR